MDDNQELPQKKIESYFSAEKLKAFLELGSVLYVLLTILGLISEYNFYNRFGINISHYLEITEVIFFVTDDLMTLLLSITFCSWYHYYIIDSIVMILEGILKALTNSKISYLKNLVTMVDQLEQKQKTIISYLLGGVVLAIIINTITYFDGYYDIIFAAYFFSLMLFKRSKNFRSILLLLGVILMTIFVTLKEPKIRQNRILSKTTNEWIKLNNDSIIRFNDRLKFLGVTKNFFFITDINDSTTHVLNRHEIKEQQLTYKK